MDISDDRIDKGKPFDWGRVSEDYARYRDIYPPVFYEKIAALRCCVKGQRVLDIGTGTGVLPRNLYGCGAQWTATDISEEQITQAQLLAGKSNMHIDFHTVSAEALDFPDESFDVITACQCFWYFQHEQVVPKLHRFLKKGGRLLILYMAWLPQEDNIAESSEKLVLHYNPQWSGAGETVHPIDLPEIVLQYFRLTHHEEYLLDIPFTRESWHGRMKACRGVGASLSAEALAQWEKEHIALIEYIAPPEFTIRHYAAYALLTKI